MTSYNQVLIYYMSGTGNALKAARWISETANTLNIPSSIHSVDRFTDISVPKHEGKTLIGFCYPTHGFNLPWLMLKFIWKFPAIKNTDVFLLNTRAGMKLYKIFTPGLSGIAQLLPMLILFIKGFSIKGLLPLDMPSNWISVHPGLRLKVVDSIVKRCERITLKFANKILQRKRYYHPVFFVFLPLDILVSPITLGYFIYGRFFFSKTFIASTQCNTCKICEELCPAHAIKIIHNKPYWTLSCESCMRCMNICPQNAIQCSHSFAAIILFIISYIPLSYWLAEYFNHFLPESGNLWFEIFDFIVSWGFAFVLLFYFYKLFFNIMQNKVVNRIVSYGSLTRYWRHYRAPGINIVDFKNKNNGTSSS
jgi:Pyruvate/2-oxoacid:ferredoxin oxidoreductase delta subunit